MIPILSIEGATYRVRRTRLDEVARILEQREVPFDYYNSPCPEINTRRGIVRCCGSAEQRRGYIVSQVFDAWDESISEKIALLLCGVGQDDSIHFEESEIEYLRELLIEMMNND